MKDCLLKNTDGYFIEYGPSFVSEWVRMIANSQKATVIISHNLEEKPAKVVVEAMTSQGLRFPGFGSVQADDDLNKEYGGVAFIYDHSVVELFVPTWNNYEKSKDGDLWYSIYTGVLRGFVGDFPL